MQNHIDQLIQQAFGFIQNGDFDASEQLLKNVIQLKPHDFNANNLLGVIYIEKGMPDECISHLKKALKIEPNNASTNYNMANAFMLKEQHSQALPFHTKATQLNPNDYWANTNYGISLSKLNQLGKAKGLLQKAVDLNPEIPSGWLNLANCLQGLGQYLEALSYLERALALDPQYIEAWSSAGANLEIQGRYQEALACYDKAVNLSPHTPELIVSKGNMLRQLQRFEESLACYNKALELLPDLIYCLVNKGNILVDLKRFDEAILFYQRAFKLKPNIDYLLGYLITNKMLVSNWPELDYEINLLSKRINLKERAIYPHPLLAISNSPDLQLENAKIWIADEYPINHTLGKIGKTSHDKIRIGYFSADFRNHPVSHLTAELYELHDRSCFEIYAFSLQAAHPDDEMRKRLLMAFDHFINAENKSDQEIAKLARELEIDIAIDLGGHTQDAKTGIFSYRAAPIQVNYLGYPGTMGARYIDYIIADKVIIPERHKPFYAEKVVYLPDTYIVDDSNRVASSRVFTRKECGLPENAFVFCCFNNAYKFNPQVLDGWSKILLAVENSILWITENNKYFKSNLITEFEKRGVNASRIIFAQRVELMTDHLARYALVDLFLDTHPYNAHSTALDSLKASTPVITLLGESFAGRVAASLLNTIGLPELITHTQAEYESLAIELAMNPERIKAIKEKLAKNRLTTPLFNTPLFAKNLELAYTKMYQRYQSDLPPDHFDT